MREYAYTRTPLFSAAARYPWHCSAVLSKTRPGGRAVCRHSIAPHEVRFYVRYAFRRRCASNNNRPRPSVRCMKKPLIVEQLPAGGERVAAGSAPEHQEVTIDRPSNCSHETAQSNEFKYTASTLSGCQTVACNNDIPSCTASLSKVLCAGPLDMSIANQALNSELCSVYSMLIIVQTSKTKIRTAYKAQRR